MRLAAWSVGVVLAAYPALAWAQQAPAGDAPAQQAGSAAADDATDPYADSADEIVVTGRAPPGQVIGDVKPELQLGPADIRAYGVDSIADLIDELAPETQSARGTGAPAVLLNGKRISSFHEIRDLPTEAILRVDILPEQTALEYGFSADQKVVNIVLRRHFRSTVVTLNDKLATEGGSNTPRARLGLVNITPDGRFNLNFDYQQTSKLLESERNVTGQPQKGYYDLAGNITPAAGASEIDPALSALAGVPVTVAGVPNGSPTLDDFATTANQANVTDLGRYRTLKPASREFSTNAVYARTIFGNVSATVNGRIDYTDSTDDLGLPGVTLTLPASNPYSPFANDVTLSRYVDLGKPLQQSAQSLASHLGMTFNGAVKKWNWSVTGNYDRSETKTFTTRSVDADALQAAILAGDPNVDPFGQLGVPLIQPGQTTLARAISNTAELNTLVTGSPFSLPAGKVSTSWHVGVSTSDFASHSVRNGLIQNGDVSRDAAEGRVNVDLPIASRRRAVLKPLGDLSANVNVAVHQLSDFGTLTRVGYGVNWSPVDRVSALVSWTRKHDAPTAQQLGNPTIITPDRRVFDYVTGETVDVTQISGGNPNLAADTQHVFEAELNVQPLSKADLRLIATYTAKRTDNLITSLPSPTEAIEAAFPDRFARDGAGALVSIDARPVNFAGESEKTLRWGFNFTAPIKSHIQKAFEAYREGKGSNPLAGLRREWRHGRSDGKQAGQSAERSDHDAPADKAGDDHPPEGDHPPSDNGGSGGGPDGGGHHGFHGGGGRHGGFGRFGGGGSGSGRIQVAVYHTWKLEDTVLIRDGLPRLDLLDGDTIGSGGGEPRHQIQGQLGYFNNGLGAQLRVNGQSGTHVNGGTAGATEPL